MWCLKQVVSGQWPSVAIVTSQCSHWGGPRAHLWAGNRWPGRWVRQQQQCHSWGVLGAEWRRFVCPLPPRVRPEDFGTTSPPSSSAKSTFPLVLVERSVDTHGQAQLQRSPNAFQPFRGGVGVGVKHWTAVGNLGNRWRSSAWKSPFSPSFFSL